MYAPASLGCPTRPHNRGQPSYCQYLLLPEQPRPPATARAPDPPAPANTRTPLLLPAPPPLPCYCAPSPATAGTLPRRSPPHPAEVAGRPGAPRTLPAEVQAGSLLLRGGNPLGREVGNPRHRLGHLQAYMGAHMRTGVRGTSSRVAGGDLLGCCQGLGGPNCRGAARVFGPVLGGSRVRCLEAMGEVPHPRHQSRPQTHVYGRTRPSPSPNPSLKNVGQLDDFADGNCRTLRVRVPCG